MIRKAVMEDMEQLKIVYHNARQYMKQTGNPTQWGDTNPAIERLEKDIEIGQLYVCHEGEEIYGAFVLQFGIEPNYVTPYEGAWLNDAPYGTIHRIGSGGTHKGVFDEAIGWCKMQIDNLRIDTHPNNKTMQHLCTSRGFVECGKITIARDGSDRIIYHWIRASAEQMQ